MVDNFFPAMDENAKAKRRAEIDEHIGNQIYQVELLTRLDNARHDPITNAKRIAQIEAELNRLGIPFPSTAQAWAHPIQEEAAILTQQDREYDLQEDSLANMYYAHNSTVSSENSISLRSTSEGEPAPPDKAGGGPPKRASSQAAPKQSKQSQTA